MKNKYVIKSGGSVNPEILKAFYKERFPKRFNFLKEHWKWQYNSQLIKNQLPRIIESDGKIIVHVSGIPFFAEINKKIFRSLWLVDIMVDPQFRRQGLASTASKDYFSFADMHFGHPNEKSIKLLKKMGWGQNYDSYFHFFFIKPLNHHRYKKKIPKIIRIFVNTLFRCFITLVYKARSYSHDAILIEKVTEENLKAFEHSQKKGTDIISTYRDWNYLDWRILKSPDISSYSIVTHKETGNKLLIKLIKDPITNHVEILMVKEPIDDHSIQRLTATICLWAVKNNFDYVLKYTTVKSRSNNLKKKLLSYRLAKNYIFFSENPEIQKLLKISTPYWDLIDDDLEKFKYV